MKVYWRWWLKINGEDRRWYVSRTEAFDAARSACRRHKDVVVEDRIAQRQWRMGLHIDGGQERLFAELQ